MGKTETLEKLQEVFRDVFDDEEVVLYPEMTAKDYDGWDSLAHLMLVATVEKAFGVRFSTGEVLQLKNVGEFVDLIVRKG